jgi:methylmalonyl-CoA/ethylmalonyl-CoA epimerase
MVTKVNHIGIMVGNLDRAIEKFKGFGIPCTEIKEAPKLNARIGFLAVGDTSLEMISFTGPPQADNTMDLIVRGNKGVINHISLEVDDIEKSIKDFEAAGAKVIEGCPKEGAHGRIAFFYPETTEGVLIELCEP